MNFKYFIILGTFFLMSCGGGSGGSTSNVGSSASAAAGTNTGQITDQLQIVE